RADPSIALFGPEGKPNGLFPLLIAAYSGNVDIFRMLLASNIPLDQISHHDGQNVLHSAVISPSVEIVEIILSYLKHKKYQFDVNTPSADGITPLLAAIGHDDIETSFKLVNLLLQAGADP